jgi:hydrogenase expression/formation protein HypC
MCQATIARILDVKGKRALAEFQNKKTELNIELLPDVKKGDYVLFAGGVAIEKVEK